ncbi:uncharacterized protein LOC131315535 [Rhododendron vialii]|uniref:uncharacterized protein LOC131315535 n=1 Tax=Rhododendron vialii TaxID=182163 RepID=UPI00265D9621|nr:uncharacterized protein LOC131315535 [Rhododendron vialii]
MRSCQEYGIQIWSPHNEHKLIMQPLPDETPTVVNQEVIPQLTSHNVPSDQALMATVDTNSVVEKEIPLTQFLPTAQQENLDAGFGNDEAKVIRMGGEETGEGVIEEAQLNSGCSKKQGKMKLNTPGGERGNNRTTGVRIAIPKEDILRTKGMRLKDVANHLGAQQENLDVDFGNDETEAIGMGGEEKGEGVIEEAQLNSGCSKKQGKRKVNTPGGERGNNRTTGIRMAIPKEDILRTKGMCLKDVANHLGGTHTYTPPRNENLNFCSCFFSQLDRLEGRTKCSKLLHVWDLGKCSCSTSANRETIFRELNS